MGIYIYLTEEEMSNMKRVDDIDVMDVFQEALLHDPTLLIKERKIRHGRFFKKIIEHTFYIFHESNSHDGKAYQAELNLSASGSRGKTIAYLTGIINGELSHNKHETRTN